MTHSLRDEAILIGRSKSYVASLACRPGRRPVAQSPSEAPERCQTIPGGDARRREVQRWLVRVRGQELVLLRRQEPSSGCEPADSLENTVDDEQDLVRRLGVAADLASPAARAIGEVKR